MTTRDSAPNGPHNGPQKGSARHLPCAASSRTAYFPESGRPVRSARKDTARMLADALSLVAQEIPA